VSELASESISTARLSPVDAPLAGPFWTAAGEGRLVIQQCESCGELRWPPLSGCPECLSRATSWVEVPPTGTIWSQVTYHRAFQAELKADIPYTVAMVALDDGPYLVGRVAPDVTAAIGDRVTAEFAEVRGAPQLRWRPVNEQAANGGSDGKA
jgi:uncharacterized protein